MLKNRKLEVFNFVAIFLLMKADENRHGFFIDVPASSMGKRTNLAKKNGKK